MKRHVAFGGALNATYQPDLIARVFELKRKVLTEEIEKNIDFGTKVALVYNIEFQKGGLPICSTSSPSL